jgi:hypothetical protein
MMMTMMIAIVQRYMVGFKYWKHALAQEFRYSHTSSLHHDTAQYRLHRMCALHDEGDESDSNRLLSHLSYHSLLLCTIPHWLVPDVGAIKNREFNDYSSILSDKAALSDLACLPLSFFSSLDDVPVKYMSVSHPATLPPYHPAEPLMRGQ